MKRLITICLVAGLILSSTCVSAGAAVGPNVNPPPNPPTWWNAPCTYYAYGWWEDDIYPHYPEVDASPPADVTHWATNFLFDGGSTNFKAYILGPDGGGNTLTINLNNIYQPNLRKEIYIYITGTTISTTGNITQNFNTGEGTFSGFYGGSIGGGLWTYMVSGEIVPQPSYETLSVTVPGLESGHVTNIWAGTNCIPEPATIALLVLGGLAVARRRKTKSSMSLN